MTKCVLGLKLWHTHNLNKIHTYIKRFFLAILLVGFVAASAGYTAIHNDFLFPIAKAQTKRLYIQCGKIQLIVVN